MMILKRSLKCRILGHYYWRDGILLRCYRCGYKVARDPSIGYKQILWIDWQWIGIGRRKLYWYVHIGFLEVRYFPPILREEQ